MIDPMTAEQGSTTPPPATKKLSPMQAPSVNKIPAPTATPAPSATGTDTKPQAAPLGAADPLAFSGTHFAGMLSQGQTPVATSIQNGVQNARRTLAAVAPGSVPPSSSSFSTAPTVPGQDLRSSTITAKSGLDRVGLANRLIQQQHAQAEPEWQRIQRELTQNAAATGQTGSGMFRTSLGDAARQHALDTQSSDLGFLADALRGGVEDDRFATNVAQQQQGFQEGQANTAFNQEQAIQNGDFQRALASLYAGNQGNPADVQLALSQLYGNQASQANQALQGAVSGSQANRDAASTADTYAKILQQLYGSGGGGSSGTTGLPGGDLVWGD